MSDESRTPRTIFLSYGHDSADDARTLKEDLEARGHTVWMDLERLKPGADWESHIEEGLRQCDQVLLLMTPAAVRRRNPADPESTDGYCLNEIAKALQCRKEIIPIMLVLVEEGPPTSICRLQWLDMTTCRPLVERSGSYPARLAQLIEAIEHGRLAAEGEQALLLALLKPADFKLEIDRHLGSYHGRSSFEAQVDEWLSEENGGPILWVVGKPGVGKSAFAVNVCHRRGDAFYMCIRGYSDQNDPRSVLTTIAYQLATHLPEYARRLVRITNLEAELEKGAPEIFDNLLLAPLSTQEFPVPDRRVLVVIDGLDEATVNGKNELAQIIARRVPQLPSWIRFIVTSREEQELIGPLHSHRRLTLSAEDAENLDAIRAAFAQCLAELGASRSEGLLDTLVTKSEGVFLWVAYVIESLRKGERTIADLPQLPGGLEAWYLSDFQRRFEDMTAYQRDLKPLLEAIVSQRAPLPLPILHEALGISLTELSRRIGRLGSLFPVREESSGERTIRAAHSSLRDWLVGIDERSFLPIAGEYVLDPELGEQCLADHGWGVYERGLLASSPYYFGFLPEHLAAAGQSERLRQLLTDLDMLVEASKAGRRYEWMRHWLKSELDPIAELGKSFEQRVSTGADTAQQAQWAEEIGRFLRDLGFVAAALPFLERSIELQSAGSGTVSVGLGTSLQSLADIHRIQQSFDRSLELYQRALDIFEQTLGPRSGPVASVYYELAVLHRDQGRYAEAISYNQRALQLMESIDPVDYRGLADCINDMGVLLMETSGSRQAEAYYRRALAIGEAHWGEDDPLTATCLYNIALLHKGAADDRDLHLLRRALKTFEKTFIPHHPELQRIRRTLASHLEARGQYLEAVSQRKTVLDNTIVVSGVDSDTAAQDTNLLQRCRRRQDSLAAWIAQTQAQIERLPEAEDSGKAALPALHEYALLVGGKDNKSHPVAATSESPQVRRLADVLFQFGAYLEDYGYYGAAVRFLTLARAAVADHDQDRDTLLRVLVRLAAAHQKRGEFRLALACGSDRLALLLERKPISIQRITDCCCNQVSLAHALGDHQAALEHARRGVELVDEACGRGSEDAVAARGKLSGVLNERAIALKNEHADYAAAEPYYRLALEIEPENTTVRGNLALLLTSCLDKHDEAEQLYRSSLAAARTNPVVIANYAFFLHNVRKDLEAARRHYEEALNVPPPDPSVLCTFAAFLITQGERSRAAELLDAAWALPREAQISQRILFVKATLELLEGRDATFYWGQLRFVLETGVLLSPWRASEYLAYLDGALPAEGLAMARSIAQALSDRSHLDQLRKTPEWLSSSFIPANEEWPTPSSV
ncbi:MAG: tetratricopeptide repeat protein [Gammaproteobacteria bacterium]|nr:tetratricopeptide repeat protein [Gammaproteobacteria bacterium]